VGSVTLTVTILSAGSVPSQIMTTITRQVPSCVSSGHIGTEGERRSWMDSERSVGASPTQKEKWDCALL
jgi:hypothetical protein